MVISVELENINNEHKWCHMNSIVEDLLVQQLVVMNMEIFKCYLFYFYKWRYCHMHLKHGIGWQGKYL